MKGILDLRIFSNTQTTDLNSPGNSLTPGMKTFYDSKLIKEAKQSLIHDQFGDVRPIPKNGGKTVEFRKYDPFDKALTQLTEGVTPAGHKLNIKTVTATVGQYGDYVEVSDMLQLAAVDNTIVEASEILANQAGLTLDTITRDVITAGTNKIFAPIVSGGTETEITSRSSVTTQSTLRPKDIRYAAAKLKRVGAKPIGDSFVAIIHPDVECDLTGNAEWIDVHKYADPKSIYRGEIGTLAGVRFVRSSEAKIIGPADMLGIPGYNRTSLNAAVNASADIYPKDVFTADAATAVNAAISAGTTYKIYVDGNECTVSSVTGGAAGVCKITLSSAVTAAKGSMVCGTGAGANGAAVYCTMVIGKNAYGVTEITGGGLEYIIKQLGSAGSSDPLNQRATTGWKATKAAERLTEAYMVRIEHSSAQFGMEALSN